MPVLAPVLDDQVRELGFGQAPPARTGRYRDHRCRRWRGFPNIWWPSSSPQPPKACLRNSSRVPAGRSAALPLGW